MKTRTTGTDLKAILVALSFILPGTTLWGQYLVAFNLRIEYKTEAVIDVETPRFSWELKHPLRNQFQNAYQVLVASSPALLEPGKADCWDSGRQGSSQMSQVAYEGKTLEGKSKYFWKVRCWDRQNEAGPWSEVASFETAITESAGWKAKWIGHDLTHLGKGEVYHLPPAPYLRKEIELKAGIESARLYVTALGLYDFFINGEKVGEDFFNPGWTNYRKRVHYHVYDVKDYLEDGENSLASVMSYGWYAGYVGFALLLGVDTVKSFYGEVPKLLAQLEVTYANGESETFVTDRSWKASGGPLLETDLLEGETYDARLEQEGWNVTGYQDEDWEQVSEYPFPEIEVLLHPGMPIRLVEEIRPVSITSRPEGYIFDMGQNFAGIVSLQVRGNAGDSVVLRYGEMLHPDGRLMTENLRLARARDTYILKGDPDGETWQPQFTYHGFQFVEVRGLKHEPDSMTIVGLPLSSDHEVAGGFECGHPLVNKLYSNIIWTQLSNFLDIPTDCPQRDERLGWTGDAQIYVESALLNRDLATFYSKWLTDLNDDQLNNGAYPNHAPTAYIRPWRRFKSGWGDAGIICPYHMFLAYGDTRIIERFWPQMELFMDFYKRHSDSSHIFREASFFQSGSGDWLAVGQRTAPDMLSTFYYGYCAGLMAEMASATGKADRAAYYKDLATKIRTAFMDHYGGEDRRLRCDSAAYGDGREYPGGELGFSGHTQTAYANAIYMDFLAGAAELESGERLVELIRESGGKLTTGFLGVKQLLPALSKTGHTELAYDLLLKTEYPSWGFEVVNGATTMWERWDSYTHENGFGGAQNAQMNSFNHYGFGAVCEWMFRNAAGIKAAAPAYREVIIRPEPDKRLGYVKSSYRSISGSIVSNWAYHDDGLSMEVGIPVNMKARICVPASSPDLIMENGVPAIDSEGLDFKGMEEGYVVFRVGSGNYHFKINNF